MACARGRLVAHHHLCTVKLPVGQCARYVRFHNQGVIQQFLELGASWRSIVWGYWEPKMEIPA